MSFNGYLKSLEGPEPIKVPTEREGEFTAQYCAAVNGLMEFIKFNDSDSSLVVSAEAIHRWTSKGYNPQLDGCERYEIKNFKLGNGMFLHYVALSGGYNPFVYSSSNNYFNHMAVISMDNSGTSKVEMMHSIYNPSTGTINIGDISFGDAIPRLAFTGSVNHHLAFNIAGAVERSGSYGVRKLFYSKVIEGSLRYEPYQLKLYSTYGSCVDDYPESMSYWDMLESTATTPKSKALLGVYGEIVGRQR